MSSNDPTPARRHPKELSLEEHRARLERRADVIRSRLLRTIDKLDARRHQVQELTHEVKELAVPVGASIAAFAVAAIGVALAVRAYSNRSAAARIEQAGGRFRHMLMQYRPQPRPSFLAEMAKKVTLSVVTIVAAEAARRVTRQVLALPAKT